VSTAPHRTRSLLTLAAFLVAVVGGGALIGLLTGPDGWYRGLTKPWFNPPDRVFGPVWTILYVMIAVAGWRTWIRSRVADTRTMTWWFGQMLLNFLWTPVFFTAHRIDLALVVIVLLLASILVFIVRSAGRDRIAALLFVPYALWVSFATILNVALLRLNPQA
jgi:benzodiazapine receptor